MQADTVVSAFLFPHTPPFPAKLLDHGNGKKKGYFREDQQEDDAEQHGDPKGKNATEDRIHGNIFGYTTDDEHVNTYRRGNEAHFHNQGDDDAEPDRVKTQIHHHGKDNGYGEHHDRQALHKAPEYDKPENQDCHDHVPIEAES